MVCLLTRSCVHHLVGELPKKRWAMTLQCEEYSVHHRSRGGTRRWTCHARRMLFPHRSSHHVVDDLLKMFLFLFICQEQRRRRATELPCIMAECVLSKLRLRRLEYLRLHWDQRRLVKEFNSEMDLYAAHHSLRAVPGTSKWDLSRQEAQRFVHRVTLMGASVESHPHEGGQILLHELE